MGVFFPVIFHILRFFMYVLTYKNSFANKINFIPCNVEQFSTLKLTCRKHLAPSIRDWPWNFKMIHTNQHLYILRYYYIVHYWLTIQYVLNAFEILFVIFICYWIVNHQPHPYTGHICLYIYIFLKHHSSYLSVIRWKRHNQWPNKLQTCSKSISCDWKKRVCFKSKRNVKFVEH